MTDNRLAETVSIFRGRCMKDWQRELEARIADMGERINRHITEEVKSEYDDIVKTMQLLPKAKALQLDIWAMDDSIKSFDLEKELLDWFDVPSHESTTSREELEAWATGLERVAQRLRAAAAEGRHKDAEDV